MAKSPPPIVYILLVAALGGAGWYGYSSGLLSRFLPSPPSPTLTKTPTTVSQPTDPQPNTPSANSTPAATVALDTSLPNPTVLAMDGSVTMVKLMQLLRNAYSQQNPNLPITYGVPDGKPNGSNKGLQALVNNSIQLAATSRPLKPEEAQAGIVAIPVARDALAIVVGKSNPFQGNLTLKQLGDIYQGKITNWSQVGGTNSPIKVLNRSPNSGTYDLFKNTVLLGQPFAPDSSTFVTFQQDVTTPILQALGSDGIGYTTVAQVENQTTVRILSIDGVSPTDRSAVQNGSYPISRNVFLAVPRKTSPAIKELIDLALSAKGQSLVQQAEFIPL